MRFDAPEHVGLWQKTGRFPAIHDAIANHVRTVVSPGDGPVLDLCSSSGLLGRRLLDLGYTVTAVQESNAALSLGLSAGVYRGVPLLEARITLGSLPLFLHWVGEQEVDTIVARRAFPELWDGVGGAGGFAQLAEGLAECGVERIVLEGRAPTRKATHPLASADAEVEALSRHGWSLSDTVGHIRELSRIPNFGYAA